MTRLASTTLKIGDLAPDFALPDLDGAPVSLRACLADSHVLLVFAPGSWSPATRRQVEQLVATGDLFHSMEVRIIVVLTQPSAAARRGFGSTGSRLILLVDAHRTLAREYGVFRAVSRDGIAICRPAVFLIERSGVIRFIYSGTDPNDCPEVDSLLLLSSWLVPEPARSAAIARESPTTAEVVRTIEVEHVGPQEALASTEPMEPTSALTPALNGSSVEEGKPVGLESGSPVKGSLQGEEPLGEAPPVVDPRNGGSALQEERH